MPRRLDLPSTVIAPGSYAHEVDTPTRSDSASLTFTREGIAPATSWPEGDLFDLRVYERDRGDGSVHLLYSARIAGGEVIHPGTGQVNPPMQVGLSWAADKDKDIIRAELDVFQTFRTAITLEFV